MRKPAFPKLPFSLFTALAIVGIGAVLVLANGGPVVSIPSHIPAYPNSTVAVPITFTSNGHSINSIVFSIDYDQTWLDYDSFTASLPPSFFGWCNDDTADPDGEIDCYIWPGPPGIVIPDGTIFTIILQTGNAPNGTIAFVNFSLDPQISFGNTDGGSTPGSTVDGSVKIGPATDIYIPLVLKDLGVAPSMTSTSTATRTATATSTRTSTPTSTGTATKTATSTASATQRPTRTPWSTRTKTATATATEDLCNNVIVNKGFEETSDTGNDGYGWELPITEHTASFSTSNPRSGVYSLLTGILPPNTPVLSYSSGYQTVYIPNKSSATLYFWHWTISSDPMVQLLPAVFWDRIADPPLPSEMSSGDWQYVWLEDFTTGVDEYVWGPVLYNHQHWERETVDLNSHLGHNVRLWFSTYNDWWSATAMYIDDVQLQVCE
jgi:hypothetical protein